MPRSNSFFLAASLALTLSPKAIEIDLRYDYDTSGFFNQAGSKEAMRACADFFEKILTDELAEINAATSGNNQNTWSARPLHPATGASLDLVNLVVPQDTLIIYLGARDLPGSTTGFATSGISVSGFPAFFNTVFYRGQAGAEANPATDFGPWGGSIAFDTRLPNGNTRVWNFSTRTADPGKADFIGVALHEICHLLGIGTAHSWTGRAGSDLLFQGAASTAANGGTAPKLTSDKGHWTNSSPGPYQSPAFGSFATPHGINQDTLMNPVSNNFGVNHLVVTDLDLAGLIDIGWQVSLPATGAISVLDGQVTFRIPTNTTFTYQIQRGNLMTPFVNLGSPITGDGSVQISTTPVPASQRDFFRFMINGNAPAARSARGISIPAPLEIQTGQASWCVKGCCHH